MSRWAETWQNQRWLPLMGWLSGIEREEWTNLAGTQRWEKADFVLPEQWEWDGAWYVDVRHAKTEDLSNPNNPNNHTHSKIFEDNDEQKQQPPHEKQLSAPSSSSSHLSNSNNNPSQPSSSSSSARAPKQDIVTDPQGWLYSSVTSFLGPYSPTAGPLSTLRRRRWIRKMVPSLVPQIDRSWGEIKQQIRADMLAGGNSITLNQPSPPLTHMSSGSKVSHLKHSAAEAVPAETKSTRVIDPYADSDDSDTTSQVRDRKFSVDSKLAQTEHVNHVSISQVEQNVTVLSPGNKDVNEGSEPVLNHVHNQNDLDDFYQGYDDDEDEDDLISNNSSDDSEIVTFT